MDVRILVGDVREKLKDLPDRSVHCIVTSPPYYGLRSYLPDGHEDKAKEIGSEQTPGDYIAEMVAVFREARRVLRDDGTLFLNLGDSYASGGRSSRGHDKLNSGRHMATRPRDGAKPKDLLMIPARVALALQAGFARCNGCDRELRSDLWPVWNGHRVCLDCERKRVAGAKILQSGPGWYLRSEIIVSKRNPMPESCQDRPTSAHEKVYLFAKNARYYYDHEAVKEPVTGSAHSRGSGVNPKAGHNAFRTKQNASFSAAVTGTVETRNLRNVWTITSKPFKGAHFATMPVELAETCIKASTSAKGCCPHCGAGWVRKTEKSAPVAPVDYEGKWLSADAQSSGRRMLANVRARRAAGEGHDNPFPAARTLGWSAACGCPSHAPVPAIILDPFGGAGTTAVAAVRLGRRAVLIELSASYAAMAASRLQDEGGMFARVAAE